MTSWLLCVEEVETGEVGVLRYNYDDGCEEFWVCLAESHNDDPDGDTWFVRRRMRGRHLIRRRQGQLKGKSKGKGKGKRAVASGKGSGSKGKRRGKGKGRRHANFPRKG